MRIWDAYLSPLDLALIAATPPPPPVGFGERPALLIIDVWQSTLGDTPLPPEQSAQRWPGSFGEPAWHAVAQTAVLLDVARRLGIPVVHTTMWTGPFAAQNWYDAVRTGRNGEQASSHRDGQFEIVECLRPIGTEVLITKVGPSAFAGTPLTSVLQQQRIDTVVVCGESTSGCVRASVVDAATLGLRVIVAEDCVYDRHEACHGINLFDMHQKYADVVPSRDVIAELERAATTRPASLD